jgi:hypothetical protein
MHSKNLTLNAGSDTRGVEYFKILEMFFNNITLFAAKVFLLEQKPHT